MLDQLWEESYILSTHQQRQMSWNSPSFCPSFWSPSIQKGLGNIQETHLLGWIVCHDDYNNPPIPHSKCFSPLTQSVNLGQHCDFCDQCNAAEVMWHTFQAWALRDLCFCSCSLHLPLPSFRKVTLEPLMRPCGERGPETCIYRVFCYLYSDTLT